MATLALTCRGEGGLAVGRTADVAGNSGAVGVGGAMGIVAMGPVVAGTSEAGDVGGMGIVTMGSVVAGTSRAGGVGGAMGIVVMGPNVDVFLLYTLYTYINIYIYFFYIAMV